MERRRLTVHGTVQGVGFRPTVYRIAVQEGLSGSVLNDGTGVFIELQGPPEALDRFESRLVAEVERPGRVEALEREVLEVDPDLDGFEIAYSRDSAEKSVSLAPDGYVCPRCLAELHDPKDRRYRYPFINCTLCGPRYTIVRALPYDRPQTTMAVFPMCPACEREYTDPMDRRYHAQPIACPVCGPWTWLVRRGGDAAVPPRPEDPAAAIDAARALLGQGLVLAIKGIGGFHLAVDARSAAGVRRLREHKQRWRKPFALMVRDVETARKIVHLDPASEALLTSSVAPILIAPRGPGAPDTELAPGIGELGVMLPYSPLHHLLLEGGDLDCLVMTSANRASEPILTDNAVALAELPADAFLLHNRDIHVGADDSVLRVGPRGPLPVRRARGYVPGALRVAGLPRRQILALGGHLKTTVATLARGELVLSRHLGDLDNPRAERAYREEVARLLRFAAVEPEAVVVDLHPDLYSTVFGEERFAHLPLIRVQHHHAHMAAVMVEHGLGPEDRVVAITLDGLGYGTDGTIWGGEVLVGGYASFERVAHLRVLPQPGGDAAARDPRRMATALLWDLGREGGPSFLPDVAAICPIRSVSPRTSSAGRLFDGVAALLGVMSEAQEYDAEAPARLEAVTDPSVEDAYPLPLAEGVLDTRVLVQALLDDEAPVPVRAARFHNGLADGLVRAAARTGRDTLVLGGGSMVNRWLLRRLADQGEAAGLRVLWPQQIPGGDGGLSAGQAAVGACRLA